MQKSLVIAKSPSTETAVIESEAFPVFENVKVFPAPLVFTSKWPKLKLPEEGLSSGATP